MKPLAGLHVVVTRPAHQAGQAQSLLEAAGAHVHLFPLLTIAAASTAPSTLQTLQTPSHYHAVIFISANAVEHGLSLLPAPTLLHQHRLGAIGKQTAQALAGHQLHAELVPEHGFSSEDLLALDALQNLSGQRILIIRGSGGREMLADTLRARGARVDYADVYQRICPTNHTISLKQLHDCRQLDIISLTSSEGLHNLLHLHHNAIWLKTVPLLVGSERIAGDARLAGFSHTLVVAANPTDAAMLDALMHWRQDKTEHDRQTGSQRN